MAMSIHQTDPRSGRPLRH